jgi:aminoglycoside 6'-N-acetyltransferase
VPERPTLPGGRLTIRPAGPGDAAALHAILGEPSVRHWWGEPGPVQSLAQDLFDDDAQDALLVIDVGGQVAGGIQYGEELDPMYRHASIDVFLSGRFTGRGLGTEAVARLARWLVEVRGHHRLTIDPAAANTVAVRCYGKVGFRPVGRLRAYERAPDGSYRDGLLMDLLADELGDEPVDELGDEPADELSPARPTTAG